jgi:hypothetical protein
MGYSVGCVVVAVNHLAGVRIPHAPLVRGCPRNGKQVAVVLPLTIWSHRLVARIAVFHTAERSSNLRGTALAYLRIEGHPSRDACETYARRNEGGCRAVQVLPANTFSVSVQVRGNAHIARWACKPGRLGLSPTESHAPVV